jgi:formate hydrogenlyase subunit 3/multisubunit Na+/H+ antiporter MnhD subunit
MYKCINGTIFIYFACALGSLLSNNLIISFAFWEALAVVATFIILFSKDHGAKYSALKYFIIHTLSGALFIVGLAAYLQVNNTGIIIYNYNTNDNKYFNKQGDERN